MSEQQYRALIDVLEQNKPSRICELGCGSSTRIFEQYCEKYHTSLTSIEDDKAWARKDTILMPVIEHDSLKLGDHVYSDCNRYDGLEAWLVSQDPFDLVMIDGPKGYGFREQYKYSRVQLLSFVLMNKLSKTATVLYHDSERNNAKTTLNEFERLLGQKFNKSIIEFNPPRKSAQLTIYQLMGDNE